MKTATRNRLIIAVVFLVAAAAIAYQMFFSLTPPRHADHDHAIAALNAGGFLWLERPDGSRRNMVGRPEKVLVLHWFDPTGSNSSEQTRAAEFASSIKSDPLVEVLFVAQAPSWDGLEDWARNAGVPMNHLYLDKEGKTGELFGVRRLPETLFYDPSGLLAHQSRGPMSWSEASVRPRIETYKAGVEEIH